MATKGGHEPPLVGFSGGVGRDFFSGGSGGIVPLSNVPVTRPRAIKAKVVARPAGVSDREGRLLGRVVGRRWLVQGLRGQMQEMAVLDGVGVQEEGRLKRSLDLGGTAVGRLRCRCPQQPVRRAAAPQASLSLLLLEGGIDFQEGEALPGPFWPQWPG